MRKLLNVLFVSTQGTYLKKDGLAIAALKRNQPTVRLPSHNLASIVVFGRVMVSPYLMNFCAANGISIAFHDEYGRFLARVEGPVSGNVLLRREQYRAADSSIRSAAIARNIVMAKIANSKNILQRFLRENPGAEYHDFDLSIAFLKSLIKSCPVEQSVDHLRGIEGIAAERYFSVFNNLLKSNQTAFQFTGRNRRPPRDPVNALLSFAYTMLAHDVAAAVASVGLDPCVGFLHVDRSGRASLALDLMEELRCFFADRLVLSLINLKQLGPKDFTTMANGAVSLSDKGRKVFLAAYQQKKQDEIIHPFTSEKIPIGLIPFVQARLLSKHIRGELPQYPPFAWR